ncbi:MAG TPA: hypothetical protein VLB09_07640, partial [Nitrospiria bacterium]|nr:hypothetical protein [Nitrospiria bacterium]
MIQKTVCPVRIFVLLVLFVLFFGGGPQWVFSTEAEPVSLKAPTKIPQGEVVLLSLPPEFKGEPVEGKLSGRKVFFFADPESGRMTALVGADLDDKAAKGELEVVVNAAGKAVEHRFPVEILAVKY